MSARWMEYENWGHSSRGYEWIEKGGSFPSSVSDRAGRLRAEAHSAQLRKTACSVRSSRRFGTGFGEWWPGARGWAVVNAVVAEFYVLDHSVASPISLVPSTLRTSHPGTLTPKGGPPALPGWQ